MSEAQEIAIKLGDLPTDDQWVTAEINRLSRKSILALNHVKELHDWFDGKRKARQSCRLIGDSRTGKTVACESYVLRNKPQQINKQTPIVPVAYIMPPAKCGTKDFFKTIIEYMKYRAGKGTVSDLRSRAMDILKACEVEMLVVDEADRLQQDTFPEVRDISDKLGIAVVLAATDRLDDVIRNDEQVLNRFRACRKFNKLVDQEFKETVDIWEKKVIALPIPSLLTTVKAQKLLIEATGGYIGKLDELLREAAIRSLSAGHKKIDFSILHEVTREYIVVSTRKK
jgi:DNA transposition AAA+ family ATPase